MAKQTVALVTGSNRGIGLAIVQSLSSSPPSQPFILYAASRSGIDLNLKANKETQVKYPKLDIGSRSSIESLVDQIKREHGSIDVVINNAGVNLDNKYNAENAKTTLDVNYRGTLAMCQSFIPLLSAEGRIVNVSSTGSSLRGYSSAVQKRFRNDSMTLKELEQLAEEYEKSAATKSESQAGFGGPGKSYSVSKACINAFTAVLAREHKGLVINACCPGWVDTDMGSMVGGAPKSPSDGAKIPIKVAFGEINGTTGRYWANDSITDTGSSKVQDW